MLENRSFIENLLTITKIISFKSVPVFVTVRILNQICLVSEWV